MVIIVILVVAAVIYGYSQSYPTDKLVGIGFAGAVVGSRDLSPRQ